MLNYGCPAPRLLPTGGRLLFWRRPLRVSDGAVERRRVVVWVMAAFGDGSLVERRAPRSLFSGGPQKKKKIKDVF